MTFAPAPLDLEAMLVASLAVTAPYKTCSCGAKYSTRADFLQLRHVRDWDDGAELLEMRACSVCTSTLAVVLETTIENDNDFEDEDDDAEDLDARARAGRNDR